MKEMSGIHSEQQSRSHNKTERLWKFEVGLIDIKINFITKSALR